MKWLKWLFGVHAPQPFPPIIEKAGAIYPIKKKDLPPDTKFDNWGIDMKLQRQTTNTDSVAWEKIEVAQVGKTATLTDQDMRYLEEKGLDMAKAMELKTHWANGKSIQDTVAVFEGKRGYSQRTVAEYYSTFSKAQK